MPIYEYQCESCNVTFEKLLSISARDEPCESKCVECGGNIRRNVCASALTSDMTMTPNKATGGRWNELMDRMKNAAGVTKKDAERLENTKSNNGRRWRG